MECNLGALGLPRQDFVEAARVLVGRDFTEHTDARLLLPPPNLLSRLLRLTQAVNGLAADVPDILAQPEVARAIEQQFIEVMVNCLDAGLPDDDRKLCESRPPTMKRFERYLEENLLNPVYITDICAAIGVSHRTLHNHCHQVLGMSPHRYLHLRRLHLTRRALTLADVGTTVTQVATDHGFWELGRFAVEYRQMFGESPSATVRRREPAISEARGMGSAPIGILWGP